MTFAEYRSLLAADLFRVKGNRSWKLLLRYVIFGGSVQYIFWFRTAAYTHSNPLLRRTTYPLVWIALRRYRFRYGIDLPWRTQVGPGLYIGHFGGIVVNGDTVIGRNCNLSQGVTLGQGSRGANKGCATIGDNVYFGPGAKVVGAVTIGDNVAVGANCVVTKDVPAGTTVAGVPGRVISDLGSEGYVNNRV